MKRKKIRAILDAAERLHLIDRRGSAGELVSAAHDIDPDECFALIEEAADAGRAVLAWYGSQLAFDALSARDAKRYLIAVWDKFVATSSRRDQLIDPAFVALRLARIAVDPVIAHGETARCDMAYVLALSLPYDATGYAHRSQDLVKALTAVGVDVTCLTKPGYPWYDGVQEHFDDNEFDGVTYRPTGDVTFSGPVNVMDFLRAEEAMFHAIRSTRPRIVMAGSNYKTALPALFAARRLGLPFIYEMRGLWELSKAVNTPGYCKTERFGKESGLEVAAALGADQVFAISYSLRAEMLRRGVPGEKIGLLPNAASLERLRPQPKDPAILARLDLADNTTVIGYVGSLTSYEGLDDLIHACAELARSGVKFNLLIAGWDPRGENKIGPALVDLARSVGIEERLKMLGQISRGDVPAVYSVIDIAPIPRKDFTVTRLVPPLKLIEAMAMGKAVVVSALPPLLEVVEDESACIVPAGDPAALSRVLAELCSDPDRRQRLGRAARQRIEAHYSWPDCASVFWKKITTAPELAKYTLPDLPAQVDVAGQADYHQSNVLLE
jgi:glycosyltransferase involved in cell wall biosynthesis